MYLLLGTLLFLVISLYLNEIIPRKHGEARHFLFPFYFLWEKVRGKRKLVGEEVPLLEAEANDSDPGVAVREEKRHSLRGSERGSEREE